MLLRGARKREEAIPYHLGRVFHSGSIGRMLPVAPEATAAGPDLNPLKNTANTNGRQHGGRLLEMWEGGFPHRMNADLSTVGLDDYDGALAPGDAFSAHPKICPVTGQMITVTQRWDEPYLSVRIFDREGRRVCATPVPSARKHVIHDLQITDNWVILFYTPAISDIGNAMRGGDPFIWQPELGARIALVPRAGGAVRWFVRKLGNTHFLIGNADTRILLSGKREKIRAEVERCLSAGNSCPGYFIAVSNHIPPNTSVESALYYNEVYEELCRR